jgi:hypothetical protein
MHLGIDEKNNLVLLRSLSNAVFLIVAPIGGAGDDNAHNFERIRYK